MLLGVSRPTIGRCLADLEKLNAIKTRYGRVHIDNRKVLAEFKDKQ